MIYARDRAIFLPYGLNAVQDRIMSHKVLLAADGISSSVAILESSNGDRLFRVNGKTDGGTSGDMATQLLLA